MNRRRLTTISGIAIISILVLSLSGCAVDPTVIESYRAYQDTIGEEYERYVLDGEPIPDWTPDEIEVRRANLADARKVVSQ